MLEKVTMSESETEEQRMLRDSLAKFLADHDIGYDSRQLWSGLSSQLGLAGALLPENVGGLSGGPAEAAIIAREFGGAGVPEPITETLIMSASLAELSTPQIADLLTRISAGEARLAWALGERNTRFELEVLETTATREGADYRIVGEKTVVIGASEATDLIVAARSEEARRVSVFLLDPKAAGITMRTYRTVDGLSAADIRFDVLIPADRLIGSDATTASILDDAHALGLIATCAEMAGAMRRMIELTVEHVRQRQQFGRPLASFQALRHHLVDAWCMAEQADAMVAYAAESYDRREHDRRAALSAAKVFMSEARRLIGRYAIQFHGAMGTTEEVEVSRHFKRLMVLETRFGSHDHHIARYLEHGSAPHDDPALRTPSR